MARRKPEPPPPAPESREPAPGGRRKVGEVNPGPTPARAGRTTPGAAARAAKIKAGGAEAAGFIVRVPASTSNLGPGFDCLGLALNLFNDFTVEPVSSGARQAHALIGRGRLANLNLGSAAEVRTNPFFELFERVGTLAGRALPGVRVTVDARVPTGAGLGSSATARVAGALAANHLLGNPFSTDQLLALVIEAEGHPDNATPAFCGGLTLTARTATGPVVHIYECHPDWRVVLHVPDYEIATRVARAKLPSRVTHQDAAFGLPRVAMVIDALIAGDGATLGRVLEDRLHEPHRGRMIKGCEPLKAAARDAGAAAVFISGAGSGLAALCLGDEVADGVAETLCDVSAKLKIPNDAMSLRVEPTGARLAE